MAVFSAPAAVAVGAMIAFGIIQRRAAHPMVPPMHRAGTASGVPYRTTFRLTRRLERPMELLPVRNTAKAPEQNFTGDVYVTSIKTPTEPSRLTAALVRFAPGARTNWHSHALGQTLHVTEGVGLVGTRDGKVIRMRAGDTVWTPPGEEHWHGGTTDAFMCHIAMLEAADGDPTTWLEPVDDQTYRAANPA